MKGHLEVICGPMYSSKSEELIKRITRAQKYRKQKTIVFKPKIDNRYNINDVVSHSGNKIEARAIKNPIEILFAYADEKYDVIGIDEVQFFDETLIVDIDILINSGARVIVAGLDTDFRGEPFGIISLLLAKAKYIVKLDAVCQVCNRDDATMTQRLTNGKPASFDEETILVGAVEKYEARCVECHEKG
jgi:thymidine kinase